VHFSPDGRFVTTLYHGITVLSYAGGAQRAYTDRVVRIWDARTGKLHCILRGHNGKVTSVTFSPDGRRALTASSDGTARVWDVATGKELVVLSATIAADHPGRALGLRTAIFSPDGEKILTISDNQVHDRPADRALPGKADLELDPPEIHPNHIGQHIDGPGSSTSARDPVLARLWNARTGKELLQSFARPASWFSSLPQTVKFSKDSEEIHMAGQQTVVIRPGNTLWDVEAASFDVKTGKELWAWKEALPDRQRVDAVDISADGQRVLLVTDTGVSIWDHLRGEEQPLRGHQRPITVARFSADEQSVLTASEDRSVRVWGTPLGPFLLPLHPEKAFELRGHEQAVRCAMFSKDGSRVLTGGADGTARVWRVEPIREHARSLKGHKGAVLSVAFSPDGRHLVTGSADRTARTWDRTTGRQLQVLQGCLSADGVELPEYIRGRAHTVAFSPDGQRIVTAADDVIAYLDRGKGPKKVPYAPVRVWSAATGKQLAELLGHQCRVSRFCFSPDGKWLLTAESDRAQITELATRDRKVISQSSRLAGKRSSAARLWDVATGKQVQIFPGHSGQIEAIAFSPDGRRVLTGHGHATTSAALRVWDTKTGKKLFTSEGAYFGLFSPSGTQIFAAINNASLHLLDAETGKKQVALEGSFWLVPRRGQQAVFSPDGKRLLAVTGNTVGIWDTTTGKQLRVLKGHQQQINSLDISRDGGLVVTASDDETARLWDVETGKEVYTLTGHRGVVHQAVFSRDGNRVATASADGTARVWSVDPLPIALAHKPRELSAVERGRFEIDSSEEK
jgi:WD40 repeat protein